MREFKYGFRVSRSGVVWTFWDWVWSTVSSGGHARCVARGGGRGDGARVPVLCGDQPVPAGVSGRCETRSAGGLSTWVCVVRGEGTSVRFTVVSVYISYYR